MANTNPQEQDVRDQDYEDWKKRSSCMSYAGPQNTHPQPFIEFWNERYPGKTIKELYGYPDDSDIPPADQRGDPGDNSMAKH